MTTIVYKNNVIAYDSRVVTGITIFDDDYDKKIEFKNHLFFLSGSTSDYEKFMNHFLDSRDNQEIKGNSVSAFVIDDKGGFFEAHSSAADGFWYVRINKSKVCAIGSGCDHAFTAMDMGATAEEAVRMAAKRDTCTGGKIRIFKF